MICSHQVRRAEEGAALQLELLLKMDDRMNRQLQCDMSEEDTSFGLADELVHYGFINEVSCNSAVVEDKHFRSLDRILCFIRFSVQVPKPARQLPADSPGDEFVPCRFIHLGQILVVLSLTCKGLQQFADGLRFPLGTPDSSPHSAGCGLESSVKIRILHSFANTLEK